MPASIRSRTWKRWRARLLVATSPLAGALGPFDFPATESVLRQQVNPPSRRLHPVDADGRGIPDPHRVAAARAEQHRLGRVQLVALASADATGRQKALVAVRERAAEADEGSRSHHAGDLALEPCLRPALEELALQQERAADRIRVALDPDGVALALRAVGA